MHSVICLNDPTQLLVRFTVTGGDTLINGDIVYNVGDHPSLHLFQPNNTIFSGTMTNLLGLKVSPHRAVLEST